MRQPALLRIKRCCLLGRVVFTEKAEDEHLADGLSRQDVIEALVNAPAVYKTLRSRSPHHSKAETLYVIVGLTHEAIIVYTKGALRRHAGQEQFYVFVSAKRSVEA